MMISREVVIPDNMLLGRIRAEYLEMPGLRLTPEQAQRLCGVEPTQCKALLDALVDAKFLCITPDGAYTRASDGEVPPLRASKRGPRSGRRVISAS
jgi:hypothetical protein